MRLNMIGLAILIGVMFPTTHFSSAAERFGARDCPDNKFLLTIHTFRTLEDGRTNLAVVIRGNELEKEKYLLRRTDGWTNLSTEKTRFRPGEIVSNCLPLGNYHIRMEYYRKTPLVGEWLTDIFEYELRIQNLEAIQLALLFYGDETRLNQRLDLILSRTGFDWQKPVWKDHLRMHWVLFTFFLIFFLILFWILFSFRSKTR